MLQIPICENYFIIAPRGIKSPTVNREKLLSTLQSKQDVDQKAKGLCPCDVENNNSLGLFEFFMVLLLEEIVIVFWEIITNWL